MWIFHLEGLLVNFSHHLDQNSWHKQLKGGKDYFHSWGYSPWWQEAVPESDMVISTGNQEVKLESESQYSLQVHLH